jgi:SnoaL-like domain
MRVATASYAATAAGVRAVIAAYAQAVDDGRHGNIAAMFCEDGPIDLPAAGVVAGREALYALFHGGHPPWLSRHVVTSTHGTRWSNGGWRFHSRTLRFADDA